MTNLAIRNPFPGAASFRVTTTGSTMDDARKLAKTGFPPGTVIVADAQSSGRGRFEDRQWRAEPGEGLLATLFLGPEAARIPGLPLRIGLAICRALGMLGVRLGKGSFSAPALKWPNDVLLGGRKVAGILCEASPDGTFIGFGINVGMTGFPPELERKATSLALAMGTEADTLDRFRILELVLDQISMVLVESSWREEAESILWKKGEKLRFQNGLPETGEVIEGRLVGLDPSGALLIDSGGPSGPAAYAAGELIVDWPARVDRNGSDHIM